MFSAPASFLTMRGVPSAVSSAEGFRPVRRVCLGVVVLLLGACGAAAVDETTTTTTLPSTTTTLPSTTTTLPTTTTTVVITTTTLPTTTTTVVDTIEVYPADPGREWLDIVRGIEDLVVESNSGWSPWTASYSDAELLEMQAEWCEDAAAHGDVGIEGAPNWLTDHPVVTTISAAVPAAVDTVDQFNLTTDALLPAQLEVGLCPELQPGYYPIDLMAEVTRTLLDLGTGTIVIPDTRDELGRETINWVFATCTNIDNQSPDRIARLFVGGDFERETGVRAIAAMAAAESYLCPGRTAGRIQQWADAGYPLADS